MKFEQYNLLPELQKSLDEMGFKKPTDIQFKALPGILKGEDVMAIAATGTGKTAAYAIPIIHKLGSSHRQYKGIRALVLAPTRELAAQIHALFVQLCRYTDLLPVAITGGVEQDPQIEQLNEEADIVVATPGRIFDLMAQGHLRLHAVEVWVLDESDRMMDLGFLKDILDISQKLPHKHQTLFFSATIHEALKKKAYSLVKNAIRIQISPKHMVSKNVQHQVMMVGMDDKRFFLERIIQQHPEATMMVFVRTQVRAQRVQAAMQRVGLSTLCIHGGMEQQDRFAAMQAFTRGQQKVLITTDVSARGIDVKSMAFVINYDIPDVAENYVHRVGRTGRGMQKGYALSFCDPEELPLLQAVEAYIGRPIDRLEIDSSDYGATLDLSREIKVDKKLILKEIAAFEKEQKAKKKKK
jgi:ATP-dependent RNA helicase RhlE